MKTSWNESLGICLTLLIFSCLQFLVSPAPRTGPGQANRQFILSAKKKLVSRPSRDPSALDQALDHVLEQSALGDSNPQKASRQQRDAQITATTSSHSDPNQDALKALLKLCEPSSVEHQDQRPARIESATTSSKSKLKKQQLVAVQAAVYNPDVAGTMGNFIQKSVFSSWDAPGGEQTDEAETSATLKFRRNLLDIHQAMENGRTLLKTASIINATRQVMMHLFRHVPP
jgi:hypothetical protein